MKKNSHIASSAELRTLLLVDPSKLWPDIEEVADGTHPHFGRQEVIGHVRAARISLAINSFPESSRDILAGGEIQVQRILGGFSTEEQKEKHSKFAIYDEFEEVLLKDEFGYTVVPRHGYEVELEWSVKVLVRPIHRRDTPVISDFFQRLQRPERVSFPWSFSSDNLRPLREGIRVASEEFPPLIALDSQKDPVGFCVVMRDRQFPRIGNLFLAVLEPFEHTGLRETILKILLTHIERSRFPKLLTRVSNLHSAAIASYRSLRFNPVGRIRGGRCDGLGSLESMLLFAREV